LKSRVAAIGDENKQIATTMKINYKFSGKGMLRRRN
jgi:hypothetical protein